MRFGLLLGMAVILGMSLPAMGGTMAETADSIIIGNATFAQGQTQVSVPVYFVTHGDITHYNLPLEIESAGDIRFMGQQVGSDLEAWDDNWQGLRNDQQQSLQIGFSDLGGDDNPVLNTNGRRVVAFNLIFAINDNPTIQSATISSMVDERSGGALFGCSDGVTEITPVVVNGILSKGTTGTPADEQLPKDVALSQNYPNPFNPTTEIEFALPDAREVKLTVFNVLGQNVRNLMSGNQEAGYHRVIWDGKDEARHVVPSGAYFYKLEAGDFSQSMKMVMLK
jgi:hypothetical protein